ncbi:MAG: polyprenyl synthetase family protein [Chlorobi bacterium]|nr:polyprenyl synthetase family protein [Chlorobiota bacterium]
MYEHHIAIIEETISYAIATSALPAELAEPILYALESGGKRLRPLMTVLAAESYGVSSKKAAPLAAAIEILHNFTLIHDDIMDRSPLRRGKPTIHVAWDEATAILAGDTMMGIAYRLLSDAYPPEVCRQLVAEFSSAFVEICIGQAEDLTFRTRRDVTMDDYTAMISRKTARLFATAAASGGIVAGAISEVVDALRRIGHAIGIAFQIRDDVLDLFGEPTFGKQRGQDLREGKKTFIVLSLANCDGVNSQLIKRYMAGESLTTDADIEQIATLCQQCGVLDRAQATINCYLDSAIEALRHVLPPSPARESLIAIAEQTRTRQL